MAYSNNPTDYVYVPLHVELYADLVRRSGEADVSSYVDHSVESFLDRTEGDGHIWSAAYMEGFGEDKEFRERYGDPKRGFQWDALLLPNGTQVRMTYAGRHVQAEIRHEGLYHGEEQMRSPSQFAGRVANNTARNAWRDLYVKFPGTDSWQVADGLRSQKASRRIGGEEAFQLSDF